MTSRKFYNADAFEHAAKVWRASGWEVETPLDADSVVWRKHHGRDFNPRADVCEWGNPLLKEMAAEGIAMLLRSDAVAVLPEWQQSAGTIPEVLIAKNSRIPLYDAETQFAIMPHFKIEIT